MRYVALVGRILFSAIFIIAGFGHFTQAEIVYAAQQGVPFASLLVPASGVMAMAGGLSILVGYHARVGACVTRDWDSTGSTMRNRLASRETSNAVAVPPPPEMPCPW